MQLVAPHHPKGLAQGCHGLPHPLGHPCAAGSPAVWPRAEQPHIHHISMPCLGFPIVSNIVTNSLSVGDAFVKQRNSSTGPRDMVCLQPRGYLFLESRCDEFEDCFLPPSKGQLSCSFSYPGWDHHHDTITFLSVPSGMPQRYTSSARDAVSTRSSQEPHGETKGRWREGEKAMGVQ